MKQISGGIKSTKSATIEQVILQGWHMVPKTRSAHSFKFK